MRRIYLDPSDCTTKDNEISIRDGSYHYLVNVLRMKQGDIFTAFDGSGYEYKIKIISIDKKTLYGVIIEKEKSLEIDPPFNINLFQCLPKKDKFETIISDVAQLGVKKVYPVISSRVIQHISKENLFHKKARWRKIAAESSKIAGRNFVMEIENPLKFEEAVKIPSDIKIIFWEKASTPLKIFLNSLQGLKAGNSVNIFIGPEGGYTDEEILLAEKYGAVSVSMGKRILKVETAAVISVALMVYEIENRLENGEF